MNISICVKKKLASILFLTGRVGKKLRQLHRRGFYLVLTYHRIIATDKLIEAGMRVSPANFERHLKFLQNNFNVIALENLKSGADTFIKDGKPKCVLTFDDGWKDFYDSAFPLLKKYGVPATVFLPTRFIDAGNQFWTDRFACLLSRRISPVGEKKVDHDIRQHIKFLNGLRGSFEEQLETGIEYLKNYPLSTIEKVLNALLTVWQVDETGAERNFLNWVEIEEMKQSGLVSFGSHTVNHQILTTLDRKEIEQELTDSREELVKRNVVDCSFVPFCYPNGNYRVEIAEMVRSAGYHLAVTTRKGWNNKDADKFTLKRIGIHEDMSSTTALFACRVAGLI